MKRISATEIEYVSEVKVKVSLLPDCDCCVGKMTGFKIFVNWDDLGIAVGLDVSGQPIQLREEDIEPILYRGSLAKLKDFFTSCLGGQSPVDLAMHLDGAPSDDIFKALERVREMAEPMGSELGKAREELRQLKEKYDALALSICGIKP